jgi:hypothetical protein
MRSLSLAACTLAAVMLTGCGDDRAGMPAGPAAPPPDLTAMAFRLTIDVASGQVTVTRPAQAGARSGVSLSLLGGEAIALQASACTFTPVPGTTKTKRYTMQLSVTNRLDGLALVRPSWPTPPAGTAGVVVFPFTASSGTITGSTAVANGDWDNAPTNFFNDFAGCVGGKTSDCYRSETFPGALLPGETSSTRTVGFDVPKAAQSATTSVVVAADLGRQVTLAATGDRCGQISVYSNQQGQDVFSTTAPGTLIVGTGEPFSDQGPPRYRGFCGFGLGSLPTGGRLLSATLRVYQAGADETLYGTSATVETDHVDLGSDLDDSDYDAAALAELGPISTSATIESKSLDVTDALLDDLDADRGFADFRLTFVGSGNGTAAFDGPSDTHPPALVVVYAD